MPVVTCPLCGRAATLPKVYLADSYTCPHCLVVIREKPAMAPRAEPLAKQPEPLPEEPPFAEIAPVLAEDSTPEDPGPDHLQKRRARTERSRVARRKLLTKLALILVLGVVTVFALRAAYFHVLWVAEQNATRK